MKEKMKPKLNIRLREFASKTFTFLTFNNVITNYISWLL